MKIPQFVLLLCMLSCCSANASFQLREMWSGTSDEQGSSLIIRPDGWGPKLGREEEERDGGGGALDKRDSERWRVSGKERVVERDLQETRWRESDGEKDEHRETCRRPQRRIRLTNYLLLHYKGCQPGRLCQLSCLSLLHTHTTYRHNLTHIPNQHIQLVLASVLSQKWTRTHAQKLYLLLTGDKGACHRGDAGCRCSNVIATPECVRQKWL